MAAGFVRGLRHVPKTEPVDKVSAIGLRVMYVVLYVRYVAWNRNIESSCDKGMAWNGSGRGQIQGSIPLLV
jgi:hypothetical protein